MSNKTEIEKLIQEFLEDLEVTYNRSLRTVNNYHFYLSRFAGYLSGKNIKVPGGITLDDVRQYRLWLNRLQSNKKEFLKSNTQNYHLIAVRAWLKYLAKRDIKALAAEKIDLARVPERSVEFLDGSDLERLLEAPLTSKNPGIIKKRDKAILETFFSTGLRVSELANLKIDSINLKKDEFTVRGKGDKPRIVFLSNQSRHWLSEYLKMRKDSNPFLFISHDRAAKGRKTVNDAGLTPRSIQRLVERYSKAAGLTKKVTPHTMRHSYATDLLMNGADIRSVQSMLGHSSITTTQIYTHITNQQLHDVHKAFHGRSRRKKS
ncbi:MAG TPA: site-specific tyrosine recombinase/integron integrase [Candidatus Bipolaricaulota bacterium]|nr:site-specific tyrosine recombinase/integron integrase [Candidatus Bipolaricaulota bacterium]